MFLKITDSFLKQFNCTQHLVTVYNFHMTTVRTSIFETVHAVNNAELVHFSSNFKPLFTQQPENTVDTSDTLWPFGVYDFLFCPFFFFFGCKLCHHSPWELSVIKALLEL